MQRRKEKADELYALTADTFRSVPLTDRKAHKSIPRAQFLQAIIDRVQQRLIVVDDNMSLSDQFDVLHNNTTWPSDVSPPWADGERLITDLCTRFGVNMVDVIPQFREYMKSAKVGRALATLLLIEQTVPISSAEAQRGFSQMNIVATDFRSRLLVSNVSDILFVRLNGPLPHMWNPASATRSWLLKSHRHR